MVADARITAIEVLADCARLAGLRLEPLVSNA
jgi:hypothetical protein